ncbi:MAG: hypothetical protein JEZ09_09635 [Salinivirgaceae bacterium]|nr:hypothetical protein [Salinivirgaceae bacterium]
MEIKYLQHNEISKMKWDKCINRSFNGIVYAYSWYLDIVAYQWDALVLGDYKAVMPLTGMKKYGFLKLVQPNYAKQLGVFTSERLDHELVNSFMEAIPDKFKVISIQLNTINKITNYKFNLQQEVTHELDLISPYKLLYLKFDIATKDAIKDSIVNKIHVMKHVNLKDFLLLKKNTSEVPVTFEHLNVLRRIIPFTMNHNIGETFGAYNDKNELIAAAFFVKSHNKVIYLLAASSEIGKELKASYAIINHYIKENAEKNLTLDFEGSTVLKRDGFAKGFGAIPINYYHVKRNRLPFFLKFLN